VWIVRIHIFALNENVSMQLRDNMKKDHLKIMERMLKNRQRLRKIGRPIGDALELCWFGVRYHYIALATLIIQFYVFYVFIQSEGNFLFFFLGGVILVFGIGLDMKNNQVPLI
jgi:hypothetical protein